MWSWCRTCGKGCHRQYLVRDLRGYCSGSRKARYIEASKCRVYPPVGETNVSLLSSVWDRHNSRRQGCVLVQCRPSKTVYVKQCRQLTCVYGCHRCSCYVANWSACGFATISGGIGRHEDVSNQSWRQEARIRQIVEFLSMI